LQVLLVEVVGRCITVALGQQLVGRAVAAGLPLLLGKQTVWAHQEQQVKATQVVMVVLMALTYLAEAVAAVQVLLVAMVVAAMVVVVEVVA
jgi:hypothetical protein